MNNNFVGIPVFFCNQCNNLHVCLFILYFLLLYETFIYYLMDTNLVCDDFYLQVPCTRYRNFIKSFDGRS